MFKKIFIAMLFSSIVILSQNNKPFTSVSIYWDGIEYVDSVSMAAGELASNILDTKGYRISILSIPASYDGSTITIYDCSTRDGVFEPVYGTADDTVISFGVTAGQSYRMRPYDFSYLRRYVKIVSDVGAATTGDIFTLTFVTYKNK